MLLLFMMDAPVRVSFDLRGQLVETTNQPIVFQDISNAREPAVEPPSFCNQVPDVATMLLLLALERLLILERLPERASNFSRVAQRPAERDLTGQDMIRGLFAEAPVG